MKDVPPDAEQILLAGAPAQPPPLVPSQSVIDAIAAAETPRRALIVRAAWRLGIFRQYAQPAELSATDLEAINHWIDELDSYAGDEKQKTGPAPHCLRRFLPATHHYWSWEGSL